MVDKVEEQTQEESTDRTNLTIQDFMNDMRLLEEQLKSRELVKPAFNIGDPTITNYILWLILGELTMLNDNLEE